MNNTRNLLRSGRVISFLLLLLASVTTNDEGHILTAGLIFVGLCCLREL